MRLRIKVLLTTVAVMALGYVMVTLASVAQIMSAARQHNARLAGRLFTHAVATGMAADPARLAEMLRSADLVAEWQVLDEAGRTVTSWNAADAVPRTGSPALAAARGPDRVQYFLHGRATPGGMGIGSYLAETMPAMLVGTVLVAAVLLLILSRQVIGPVSDLAAASRQLASGGDPARPAGAARNDEVGQLVSSFNRMADEVMGHRRELEKRVAEATEKYRRAQEAAAIAQRLAATGRLAAGVAHEINNPLGGMVNAARRLEKCAAPGSREREYLDLINEGLERIARIVRQMTQFQRSAREPVPVDISGALDDALRFAEHRLAGAELVRQVSPELPAVLGDRHGLEQVFLNLILNAADAVKDSAAKRVTVRARVAGDGQSAADGSAAPASGSVQPAVVVEVEDTGCGMTPEERDAAFDIFHTTKGAGEGSGLGLPVAHSIVESHGGTLVLESEKLRGTRAVVTLPAALRSREAGL